MNKPCACCNQIVPKFNNLSSQNEKLVRQIYKDSGPISAVKKLRDLTGSGLKEAKEWVDHCGEYYQGKTLPCPYCNELLRTSASKQCHHCWLDWHDENNIKFLK